jgi:flagellar hook-associated protein 2
MSSASITSSTGPLDVQGLVSQLMTVANQPLDRMNSQLQSYNTQISDYGTLSSDLTALQSSLTSLSSGSFINTLKAASSNTDVMSATASNSANAGSYNVTVNALASAQNLAFTGQASETASLGNTADTLNFTFGGGQTASVGIAANASLDDIAASINAAGVGVAASVVKADNSSTPYRLVLTGNSVGAGQSFSTASASGQTALSFLSFDAASAVDSSGHTVDNRLTAQAQDASLTVNGLTMTSSSDTVTNAVLGVTMNLTQTGSTVLNVTRDTAAIQGQVQSFVTAYNKLQGDSASLYKGDLQGDYNMVEIQDTFSSLLNTPISGADGSTKVAYLAQVGVSLQKDGTLSLDTTALDNAITNNATDVANVFGNSNNDGFAQRFNTTINELLGPQGLVTTRDTTLNQMVSDEKDAISREQTRLDTVQQSYLTLYSNLNSALAQMEQTSSSLTAMISSSSSTG